MSTNNSLPQKIYFLSKGFAHCHSGDATNPPEVLRLGAAILYTCMCMNLSVCLSVYSCTCVSLHERSISSYMYGDPMPWLVSGMYCKLENQCTLLFWRIANSTELVFTSMCSSSISLLYCMLFNSCFNVTSQPKWHDENSLWPSPVCLQWSRRIIKIFLS